MSPSSSLRRREVYRGVVVDGRPVRPAAAVRWRRRIDSLLVSPAEREEAELENRLRTQPPPTRPNTVAVVSPKGGVGKTTSTFMLGNVLASHLRLRVVAVDTNPDFGTLAALSPDEVRCERNLADLFTHIDTVNNATALRRYVSPLPSGLHLLAAPRDPKVMAQIGPDSYGQMLAFLSVYYDVVLMDLGTGLAAPLARFALERSDQVVLVTTPEWVTSSAVLNAVEHLRQGEHDRFTVVANKFYGRRLGDLRALEEALRQRGLARRVGIPYDEQLALQLDSGTFTLGALERPTRMAAKRLALQVAELLA